VDGHIHELLHCNLHEVLAKATRRGVALPSQNSILKTACSTRRPAGSSGMRAWTKFAGDLRATHPHFVYTPHGEPQALHNAGRLAWGSGRATRRPTTRAWM
jgi:hypothetical protein